MHSNNRFGLDDASKPRGGLRCASGWWMLASCLLWLGASAALAEAPPQGFRVSPSIGWTSGDHSVDLSLTSRIRSEWWDAHASSNDGFYAARTRVGLKYSYAELLTAYGEFQDARMYSLSPYTSGAGALYRTFGDGGSDTYTDDVRQLYLEVKPVAGLALRGGRFDIKLGTEVMYPEPDWKYVKVNRASQRLVGTVGWTHVERSNDGASLAFGTDNHHLFAFAVRPTTGVFESDKAYSHQSDINYGGLSWTVKRDVWMPNTELRFFGLAYKDDRSVRDGGLPDDVEVYTAGFSTIGFYPVGPGRADLLFWGAYQFGDYNDDDHSAAAGILEVGYQLPDVPLAPWFRLGVNVASGDGDSDDGDHDTFFNMLPTNHLYYGFADRFAFQNIVDYFAQLMLKPHSKVAVNLALHQFDLQNDDDARYFGTGAFNKDVFGYGAQPSRGSKNMATELDAVVNIEVNRHLNVRGGYAYMWGHTQFNNLSDEDVKFGYLELTFTY